MPKKSAKKTVARTSAAKSSRSVAKPTRVVHRSTPARKHGLSDMTLMFLALFFALSALFVVMKYKQQKAEFENYMQVQENRKMLYVPGTDVR